MRDDPGRDREAERLRLAVELAEQNAGLHARDVRRSGSTRMPFIGEVDQQGVIRDRQAGKLWPPLRTATGSPLSRQT